MICYQQRINAAVESRYRRLAGPFGDTEEHILRNMQAFLIETKARVLTVGEPEGVTLWRLASECETMEQTENRLRRLRAS